MSADLRALGINRFDYRFNRPNYWSTRKLIFIIRNTYNSLHGTAIIPNQLIARPMHLSRFRSKHALYVGLHAIMYRVLHVFHYMSVYIHMCVTVCVLPPHARQFYSQVSPASGKSLQPATATRPMNCAGPTLPTTIPGPEKSTREIPTLKRERVRANFRRSSATSIRPVDASLDEPRWRRPNGQDRLPSASKHAITTNGRGRSVDTSVCILFQGVC